MLVGQKFGPFLIDKELGSGAMGTVYRATFTKTGQRVAVKVMALGLGSNERSLARFEREGEILKQLKHPNIVRLFGVGKTHGTPYYAMEYIEGEALDRVMQRRQRLTWEEVVALGQQLCDALHHAHMQGIVHRDLKPSNVMVLKDGTLKLTDFGIAKDLDVTQLTSANCTVGTAAYMSPEQCRGEPNLTYKSDLYSMGVLFYELLVGQKPFQAKNAMDMFMLHVNGAFERPSRMTLDIPIWLDTLICQLMEKKPEHRPRDAAMVKEVLGGIAEKVANQKSAGAEAAQKRFADRHPASATPDKEDRETAKLLLGPRFRVKRRKKARPFHERKWVHALGLGTLLVAALAALVFALSPPSAAALYEEAERLMRTGDLDEMVEAQEKPLTKYFQFHWKRDKDAERKAQMEAWNDQVDAAVRLDQLKKKIARAKNRGQPFDWEGIGELHASRALRFEEFGDPFTAWEEWGKIVEAQQAGKEAESKIVLVARERRRQLGEALQNVHRARANRLAFLERKVEAADRLAQEKRPEKANQLRKEIVSLYEEVEDEDVRALVKKVQDAMDSKDKKEKSKD